MIWEMILVWFGDVFGMILGCFGDDFGMFWGWFWVVLGMILGCFGDGGAVITNSQQIYKRILLLRDHGRNNGNVK